MARRSVYLLVPLVVLVVLTLSSGEPKQQARLSVTVLDAETGQPTAVRARLTDADGRVAPLPDAAIGVMYGVWDHADGYAYLPDSSFYVAGSFELDLTPGVYTLALSKGNEYLAQQRTLDLTSGASVEKTYHLERWINTPALGWYSTDGHIHLRRSPRENPYLLDWIKAEDVHVGVLLRMGDFWEIYYSQYAWGEDGVYQRDDYLLTSGQEDPRTPELGHVLGMGARDRVRYSDRYYLYDLVLDRIRELGGVAGYAHQGESFAGYRGLTLDGLRGKVDVVELVQFCVEEGPLITDHYYHLLDLGYPVTAVAGSDFPWCGYDHRYGLNDIPFEKAARIGNARFYVYTGDTLTYDRWKAAIDSGHTFATTGPVLFLTVEDHLPGDRVEVSEGESVRVTAHAYGHPSQVPLESIEIVGHGAVMHSVNAGSSGQSTDHLVLELDLPVERGIWLAARAFAGPLQVAHTTPVYVTVGNGGFHNPETVSSYLDLSESYLRELEDVISTPSDNVEHQAWRYREGLEARISETRAVIEALREKLD